MTTAWYLKYHLQFVAIIKHYKWKCHTQTQHVICAHLCNNSDTPNSFCLIRKEKECIDFDAIVNECSNIIVSYGVRSSIQSIDTYLSVKWTHTTRVNLFASSHSQFSRGSHSLFHSSVLMQSTSYTIQSMHFNETLSFPANICLSIWYRFQIYSVFRS